MLLQRLSFLLLSLLLPVMASANDHYSYELSERLKPLIEWRDYGPAAFDEAVRTQKPMFLLLTAPSWCYWCQVYESEEYLFHPSVVSYINANFIPIYVDADRRQDLTRQYLEGGWPSTTVLAPSQERLLGFSGPRPVREMLGMLQEAVAFVARGGGATSNAPPSYRPEPPVAPSEQDLRSLIAIWEETATTLFDPVYGGFGQGQKFPQPLTLDAFLDRYEETKDTAFLERVQKTLQNEYTRLEEIETDYNLFDPIEGGFHRYGTRRDYTPPHYEKMLGDNANLLRTYAHLLALAKDPMAEEVVTKTLRFLREDLYDQQIGGFAGNVDAFDEDAYYGKANRPAHKPRIERTIYMDWNAQAVIALLDTSKQLSDPVSQEMARKTLILLLTEMFDEKGAYHYLSPEGIRGVQGNLLDNAWLLLASVEAARLDSDPAFLSGAKRIAAFAFEKLYDWNSGGFFERNSQDVAIYSPVELLVTERPSEENGIMAYALASLYKLTQDPLYLLGAVRTMGRLIGAAGSLDRGVYAMKAAQVMLGDTLLEAFQKEQGTIETLEQRHRQSFFLNVQAAPPPSPDPSSPPPLRGSLLVFLLVAFLSGLLSFLSPCTLPILPAYAASTLQTDPGRQICMGEAFLAGLSAVFSLLGMSATFLGSLLRSHLPLLTQIVGVFLVVIGIAAMFGWGFPAPVTLGGARKRTVLGSFLFGGSFGLAWTPCVGPILASILLLAATVGSALNGGLLLLTYALGLGVPLLLFSGALQRLPPEGRLWRLLRGRGFKVSVGGLTLSLHTTSLISGLLFVLLGLLIATNSLTILNRYVVSSPLARWIFQGEGALLRLLQ